MSLSSHRLFWSQLTCNTLTISPSLKYSTCLSKKKVKRNKLQQGRECLVLRVKSKSWMNNTKILNHIITTLKTITRERDRLSIRVYSKIKISHSQCRRKIPKRRWMRRIITGSLMRSSHPWRRKIGVELVQTRRKV